MNEAVDLIRKFADQTHLLCFNVAISASALHTLKDAFDQMQVTPGNVPEIQRAASKTLSDPRQIESQIRSLTGMYLKLEQIAVQFKIR